MEKFTVYANVNHEAEGRSGIGNKNADGNDISGVENDSWFLVIRESWV